MAVKQISVFIENKIGGLASVTDTLAKAGVNIRALSIAETPDFGVLRMIVDNVYEAGVALKENGNVYAITDVIAVAGEDKPGSIAKIISALAAGNVSLEYAYAFFGKNQDTAYMIVKVADMEQATALLKSHGIAVVDDDQLSNL